MSNEQFKTLLDRYKDNPLLLCYEYYLVENKGKNVSLDGFRELFPNWLVQMQIEKMFHGIPPKEIVNQGLEIVKQYLIRKHG